MHGALEKENAKIRSAMGSLFFETRKKGKGGVKRMLSTGGARVRTVKSRLYKWLASNIEVSEDVLRPVEVLLLDIRQRFLFARFSNLSLE